MNAELDAWAAELSELMRTPSVSDDPAHATDVDTAAAWVCSFVRRAPGTCDALGEIPAIDGAVAPTVLLYGHVEAQLVGDLAPWQLPPFEPAVRDGWLCDRGSADDAGNFYLLLKAAASLYEEGRLPVYLRVLCDAEGQAVGESVVEWIDAQETIANAAIIFDGPLRRRDVFAFKIGARGLVCLHPRLTAGGRDLHSGFFGGTALNAAEAFAWMVADVEPRNAKLKPLMAPTSEVEFANWSHLDAGVDVLAGQGARAEGRSRGGRPLHLRVHLDGGRRERHSLGRGEAPEGNSAGRRERKRVDSGRSRSRLVAGRGRSRRLPRLAGAEGRAARDRASRADPRCARSRGNSGDLARARGVRAHAAGASAAHSVERDAAGRRGARPQPYPAIEIGFDFPEGNVHEPNERPLVEYIPFGIAAARETLLAFAGLPPAA